MQTFTRLLFLLFLVMMYTPKTPAKPNDHSPGMQKTSTVAPPDTSNTLTDWLLTFFESVFEADDTLAHPQTDANTDTIDWDAEYHLSDPIDSTATNAHKSPPENGVRIGCLCMDNTRQDDVGRGACGGRGGVRFWLYHVPGMDSVLSFATQRHHSHPNELSDLELMQLDAHNPYRKHTDKDDNNLPFIPIGPIMQLLSVVVLCVTVLKVVQAMMK